MFMEPEAESKFDAWMVVGWSTVALLTSALLGLIMGLAV